uniref:NR LBD domain-containing protein n=1 Tax=Meloidogyne hapla TaxID=6305 RepID=A0A1I8B7R0_MELHA
MNENKNLKNKELYCAICGKQSESRNYNVISCAREKCRGCRLDKCLVEGMDPSTIKINDSNCRKKFIEKLEKRRYKLQRIILQQQNQEVYLNNRNEEDERNEEEEELINEQNNQKINCFENEYRQSKTNNQCVGTSYENYNNTTIGRENRLLPINETAESSQMENLIRICEAQSRIINAFMDFDEQKFLSTNCHSLEDILTFGPNIISKVSEFSEIRNQKKLNELSEFTSTVERRYIIVDRLVCIGIFKSLPFFSKLDLADQLIIIKHSILALTMICNCFNSYELGSYTWIRNDGTCPMVTISTHEKFKEDKKLYSIGNKIFTNPIEAFYNIGITKKEISLLLAIICTNSEIRGLSESAKNILSIESSRYLKILLNYLQKQLGQDAGTLKFSECIHLLGSAYSGAKYVGTFLTYLEIFYRKPVIEPTYPNWLKSIKIV